MVRRRPSPTRTIGEDAEVLVTDWLGYGRRPRLDNGVLAIDVSSAIQYVTILAGDETVAPHVEVVAVAEPRFVPHPVRPESAALVTEARSNGPSDSENYLMRCPPLEVWFTGLVTEYASPKRWDRMIPAGQRLIRDWSRLLSADLDRYYGTRGKGRDDAQHLLPTHL
jgi:hypothetical protein